MIVNSPFVGRFNPLQEAIIRVSGGGISKLLQLPQADSTGQINLKLWTDTRDDDLEVLDFESNYRTIPGALNTKVPGGVVPITGGRVVRNYISKSEDFADATWSVSGTATKEGWVVGIAPDGSDAYEIGFAATNDALLFNYGTIGDERVMSVMVRAKAGVCDIKLRVGSGGASVGIEITETWVELSYSQLFAGGSVLRIYAGTSVGNIYIKCAQIENVTDQTNQNPGEYQKTDSANGFYGFAYYSTENGNTVTDNVITRAVGADISPAPTLVHWPASTNVFLSSTAPVTQTITLSATGSWTISVAGAGSAAITANTATGTGFGSATEGVDVTVNITSTGSVDVTITDPLDWVQLENLAFSTPPIETAGVAVSRDAVSIGHPVTGVIKDAGGVLHIRLTPAFAQSDLFAINGVVSLQSATPFSLLYARSAGLRSTDGINTASVNPAFVANAEIEIAVRWSAALGELQIGYNDGSWTWGSAVAYAGVFVQDTRLNMFYGLSQNATISLCDIYGADMGTAAIEAL